MRIGAYQLGAVLGQGAMGTVYATRDPRIAIKILAQATREADVLARLDHPNIVRLIEAGTTSDGRAYLVMERIEGVPITEAARTRVQLLRLFGDACAALEHVHGRGVVHGDLKPENLLVAKGGVVKLLDFGLARAPDAARRTGTSRVTSEYASPEQLHAGAITAASDIYSLGAVLYEALTGAPPHPASLLERLAAAAPVAPPRITRAIDRIVMTALAEDPHERPTAAALAAQLARCRRKRKRRGGPAVS